MVERMSVCLSHHSIAAVVGMPLSAAQAEDNE